MKKLDFKKTASIAVKKVIKETSSPVVAAAKRDHPLSVVAAGAIIVAVSNHFGLDVQQVVEVSGLSMQDIAAIAVTGVWLAAGWVSSKRGIKDEQDVVTPR